MASAEIDWTFDGVREWDGEPTQSPITIVAGIPFALSAYYSEYGDEFFVTLGCQIGEEFENEDWWADISYTLTLLNADPNLNRVQEGDFTLTYNLRYDCAMMFDGYDDVLELNGVRKGFIVANRLSMKAIFTVHNVCGVPQPNIHLN
ncbi:hypothetical protein PFISCL1PPCAC_21213 [Pristionchus fissidentatus]|uniref:Uncharacterized protein n=1 Tax=Pristionchus fissidentatus TaxID=1538716 RepID=A0AAV5WGB4_9BILA|nr:hypothetical protein PFISCL1PPCAC_21213 [Pristionchus fissidentatus]